MIPAIQKSENPAPGPRGAFKYDQSKPQPVATTYSVGPRSGQLAASERHLSKMMPCFMAYCAVLACRVRDRNLVLPMANAMAMRFANCTGVTVAIGIKDVELIFTDEFLYSLDCAASRRIDHQSAYDVYVSLLDPAFEAYCVKLACRVRDREITFTAAANDAYDFAKSNGLTKAVGYDRVRRIMAAVFAKTKREAA